MVEVSSGQYMVDNVEYFVTTIIPYSLTVLSGTTLIPQNFNANSDAETLMIALKDKDFKTIGNILCSRSNSQRIDIERVYASMNQNDLITDVGKKLSGDFKNLVTALLYAPSEFDAYEMNSAIKGKVPVLIEILSTRTNLEIKTMQEIYFKLFSKHLLDDINKGTKDQVKDILNSLAKANRNETIHVNIHEASLEAEKLKNADKNAWEKFFNERATTESLTQLQAVFNEYKKLSGNDVETTVKKLFKGDAETCYLVLVKIARNQTAYFAELLYKTMKGIGTSDRDLVRIVVSRCEKDMVQIKEEFEKLYKETLVSFIKDDTSGNYRDGLITLVTGIPA